ncbi:hypothetical protein Leryth_009489, partial [Lithospermum erythrorhizon]
NRDVGGDSEADKRGGVRIRDRQKSCLCLQDHSQHAHLRAWAPFILIDAFINPTLCHVFFGWTGFAEREHGEVTFPEISTTILEKICQYFHWSLQYASHRCAYLCKLHLSVPSGKETEFHIEPEDEIENIFDAEVPTISSAVQMFQLRSSIFARLLPI